MDAIRHQLNHLAPWDGRRITRRPFATSLRRLPIAFVLLAAALLPGAAGCGPRQADAEGADRDASPPVLAPAPTPEGERPTTADSIREERRSAELQEFRAAQGAPLARLTGGASTAAELVRRFAAALERRDTTALRELALTRSEFAYLYYDTHPMSKPPYDLPPGLMWFQLQGNSSRGLRLLLAKRAGEPLAIVGHRCDAPVMYGPRNRFHGGCVVERQTAAGGVHAESLFGSILEREGVFKIVSYSNDL